MDSEQNLEQNIKLSIENAKSKATITFEICKQAMASLDLTSLNDNDTDEVIKKLCAQAKSSSVPTASVCVYPQFVKIASEELKDTDISIATVINFPKGQDSPEKVYSDTIEAIVNGADEIDVVWNFKAYMEGHPEQANIIVSKCRQAIDEENKKNNKNVILKVILETGALCEMKTSLPVYNASLSAIKNGADIIKTSTGKIPQGASLEAAANMLMAILKTKKETSKIVGLKVSGGVRTCQQAAEYIMLFNEILNKNSKEIELSKKTFRIGASGLFNALTKEMENYKN